MTGSFEDLAQGSFWWVEPAAKRRHIHSLGRQPQVLGITGSGSPEGATDRGCGVSRSHHPPFVCRRFAANPLYCTVFLGLTPQAMDLSRLRRSVACPTFVTRIKSRSDRPHQYSDFVSVAARRAVNRSAGRDGYRCDAAACHGVEL